MKFLIPFLSFLVASCATLNETPRKYRGFGSNSKGGLNGVKYRVLNLKSQGPGSLRYGVRQSGPRTIVFDVAGNINLTKPIIIRNPFLTIRGETAPKPGITLKGAGIVIKTSEVIIQHLRVRVGDHKSGPDPSDRDGISIQSPKKNISGISNIIVDHCSVSWAIDENMSTWSSGGPVKNVSITNNIISEGLKFSTHPKGRHSMGLLIGDKSQNISVIGNIFAHNHGRNPLLKGGVKAEIISNLVYNPGQPAVSFSDTYKSGSIHALVINNIFIPGKNTKHKKRHFSFGRKISKESKIYLSGNQGPGLSINRQWATANYKGSDKDFFKKVKIYNSRRKNTKFITFEYLITQAGARPSNRDQTDLRIIREIKERNGQHINTPSSI